MLRSPCHLAALPAEAQEVLLRTVRCGTKLDGSEHGRVKLESVAEHFSVLAIALTHHPCEPIVVEITVGLLVLDLSHIYSVRQLRIKP
jgi:hypothetical protein